MLFLRRAWSLNDYAKATSSHLRRPRQVGHPSQHRARPLPVRLRTVTSPNSNSNLTTIFTFRSPPCLVLDHLPRSEFDTHSLSSRSLSRRARLPIPVSAMNCLATRWATFPTFVVVTCVHCARTQTLNFSSSVSTLSSSTLRHILSRATRNVKSTQTSCSFATPQRR